MIGAGILALELKPRRVTRLSLRSSHDATDAAALSAVDVLAPYFSSGELVDSGEAAGNMIAIPRSANCRVSGGQLGGCSSVSWLDGYYLYYCNDYDPDEDCARGDVEDGADRQGAEDCPGETQRRS